MATHELLRKAMKGFGTNEKALTANICDKTFEEMQQISSDYKETYDRDLIKDLKSELSGNYEKVLVGLCTPRAEYDAQLLHKAFAGLGTNEKLMAEVACFRTKDELKEIEEAYNTLYSDEDDLITRIENETSGNLEKLMLKIFEPADPDKDPEDSDAVRADVEKLYKAGQGKLGTDEGVFIRIIGGSSREYCEKLYWSYAENTKKGWSLTRAIKSEFSGKLEKMLVALVTPMYVYFGDELWDSMDGMGTNESKLIRCIICMKERALQEIAEKYLEKRGKTLEAHIKSETSGNFEKSLIAILDNFAKLGS